MTICTYALQVVHEIKELKRQPRRDEALGLLRQLAVDTSQVRERAATDTTTLPYPPDTYGALPFILPSPPSSFSLCVLQVLKRYHWRIKCLKEFFPKNAGLLGQNANRLDVILLRPNQPCDTSCSYTASTLRADPT